MSIKREVRKIVENASNLSIYILDLKKFKMSHFLNKIKAIKILWNDCHLKYGQNSLYKGDFGQIEPKTRFFAYSDQISGFMGSWHVF